MQTAVKRNVAYDLSRFDNRQVVREQVAKENTAEQRKKNPKKKEASRTCVSGFAVFSWILCMALLFMIIYSYVALTETADQLNKLQNKLDDMKEETQMLEIQKSQKYSSEQMQTIAVEQLGMQKLEKSQITYVNTQQGDRAEIIGNETILSGDSKFLAGIANGFHTFVEYIN